MRNAHFDHVASVYDETLPGHVLAHYVNRRVKLVKHLVAEGTILDVGCGTGVLANKIAETGLSVVGLDLCAEMVAIANREGPPAGLTVGCSYQLPFKEESFDLVMSVATLHHIADRCQIEQTIGEMTRVLKRGGVILIWDHNPNNPYWPFLMKRLPQDDCDYRLVPAGEILSDLRQVGVGARLSRRGWIPDFAPRPLLPVFQALETVLESLPLVRRLSAHNVVIGTKT